jgi:nucleoid-associated protein YgaU
LVVGAVGAAALVAALAWNYAFDWDSPESRPTAPAEVALTPPAAAPAPPPAIPESPPAPRDEPPVAATPPASAPSDQPVVAAVPASPPAPRDQPPVTAAPPPTPSEQPAVAAVSASPPAPRDQPPVTAAPPPAPSEQPPAPQPIALPLPPSFDVVRVDAKGDAVIAGRAEPTMAVTVFDGGQAIGTVTADRRGEWVLLPIERLPAGSRALSLVGRMPDGSVVESPQVVVLVVPEPGLDIAGRPVEAPAEPLSLMVSRDETGDPVVLQAPPAPPSPAQVASVDSAAGAAPEPAVTSRPAEPIAAPGLPAATTASPAAPKSPPALPEPAIPVAASTPPEPAPVIVAHAPPAPTPTPAPSPAVRESQATVTAAVGPPEPAATTPPAAPEIAVVAKPPPGDAPEVGRPVPEASAVAAPPAAATQVARPRPQAMTVPRAAPVPARELSLRLVDYDEGGRLVVAGTAEPDARLFVYLSNRLIGDTEASSDGGWRLRPNNPVAPGEYRLRVDDVSAAGKVLARIEVPFTRSDVAGPLPRNTYAIVQPGNSLWRIARRTYGTGFKYTVIYDANKDRIRDPDLIYPGQVFSLPKGE